MTATVVRRIDRQNFEASVLRLCDEKATNLLRSSVVGGQGTIKFLEIMKLIVDSFMDIELTAIQRVEKIWYSVFMMLYDIFVRLPLEHHIPCI